MKNLLAALGAALLLTACATQQTGTTTTQQTAQTQPAPPQPKGRRLEILFLGDNGHHQPGKMAPYAMAALGNRGINFTYTDRLEEITPAYLAKFDGLLLFANWDSIPAAQEQALLDYVAGGKGLIAVHCASWCFRNSEPLVRMMGGQFWRHTWDTIRPVWVKPEHPVLAGTKPVSTLDETYLHQKLQPDNLVLTERLIQADQAKDKPGQSTEPYTWVRTHGKGRVFYTAYGHDQNTWANADFQNLLEKGIKWAVGDEANRALAALNPQPFRYHEANLPNYERRPGPQLQQAPLPPEESMKHLQVHPDFTLSLVAHEPGIQHPIAMAWDEKARPFVIVTLDYPNERKPEGQGNDFILRLDDTNGDGKTDSYVKFAENLSVPTSLVAYDGGFIVSQAPDMLFLKDTDGDGKADLRKVLFTGFGTFDTHAGPSNLHYGFDNYIYGSVGYAGFKGTVGGKAHNFTQGFFRFRPDGSDLEFLTATSNNTWGLAFDETGNLFGSTANNDHGWYMAIPNRYLAGVEKLRQRGGRGIDTHKDMKPLARIRQVDVFGGFTAAAGHSFYTARAFPKSFWNKVAFVAEPTGHLVHLNPVEKSGTDFSDKNSFNLIAGADEWFSPVFAEVGPDGAVYVLDWYSFIIQHNPTPKGFENGPGNAYQTDLRDNSHGRMYRIAYKNAPAYTPLSLSKDRPDELLAALRNNNLFWRQTAQRLLVERGKTDVLPQLLALANDQTRDELGLSPGAIHALWTLHGLGMLNGSNAEALQAATAALRHPDPAVRKTAVQVLPATDATAQALLAANALQDAEPLVVLNTVLKLSETAPTPAVDAALAGLFDTKTFLADRWLPDALTTTATAHQFRGMRSLLAKAPRKTAAPGPAMVGGAMNHEGAHHPLPPEGGSPAGTKNRAADRPLQGAGGENSKPDLVITAIRATPAAPTVQETVRLSVEVENRGGGAVPKGVPIPLAIRIEGPGKTVDLVSETFADGLAPGAKASIAEVTNGPWKGGLTMYSDAPGDFTVSVQADPAGLIPEVADGNNAFRQKITYAPLASLTDYVLENAARGYAAVMPVDSVVALVASLQTVNDGDAKAVLTGLTRAVDPKAKVTVQPADQQVLARAEPKFSPENRALLGKLLVAWGLRTDASADPNTQVVRMKVVPEKLLFDKKEFTVEAGRPVEITVENGDQMQHNMVICKPKSLDVVGAAADKMITMPNGQLKNYVPEIPQVLAATRLINPDESARLAFTAPAEPGVYPFVCTFPGHWRVMNGVMRVVKAPATAPGAKK